MDSRTTTTIEFSTKLGFNQHDLIMTKEQSVSIKIMKVFCSKKIISPQHSVLSCRIDLYFPKHRLAIIDGKGHKDRDEHEIERQKAIEKELNYKFIRINPNKKDLDVSVEIGRIYNHINKSLIGKISKRLSELNLSQIIQ